MKKILLLLAFCYATIGQAQTTSTFEEFALDSESYLNGDDGSGGFVSGNMFFPNVYNSTYNFFTDWAISNTTDITTTGPDNRYSCIAGSGAENSETYAVASAFSPTYIRMENEAQDETVAGLYITNSTWAALEMLNSTNAYSKTFGGATGDDPDWFLLSIKKIQNGTLSTDSVNFYLADYRFEDNSQDYIVNEWTYVDLSSLGDVDSLVFTLSSSDTGTYGMNTPAFFCIDNATSSDGIVDTNSPVVSSSLELFPNPSSQLLNVRNIAMNSVCQVYTLQGKLLLSQKAGGDMLTIDVDQLVAGTYVLTVNENGVIRSRTFMKQ